MITYVIITAAEVANVDFSQVLEDSANTLRYNSDNTKTFVKFEGSTPSFLQGKISYSHTEMLALLDDENGEWYYV